MNSKRFRRFLPLRSVLQLCTRGLIILAGVASGYCQNLINLDFGDAQGAKVGFAAVGTSAEDYWNVVAGSTATVQNLRFANGDFSGVSLCFSNAPNRQGNGADDPMYSTLLGASGSPPYPSATFGKMHSAIYDVYIYGHGPLTNQNGVYSLNVSGLNYGTNQTSNSADWNSSTWKEGLQYIISRDCDNQRGSINSGAGSSKWSQ